MNQARFALRNFAGDPTAFYRVEPETLDTSGAKAASQPTHHIIGIDGFARRLGVPVLLGHVAYEAVTRGARLRFPKPRHLLRAIPTYIMQGAPSSSLADWMVGLEFGFPWSKMEIASARASDELRIRGTRRPSL